MYKLATTLTLMCEVRQTNPIVEVLGQDVIDPDLLLRGEELRQVGPVIPTELETLNYKLGLRKPGLHLLGSEPVHGISGDEIAVGASLSSNPACRTGSHTEN